MSIPDGSLSAPCRRCHVGALISLALAVSLPSPGFAQRILERLERGGVAVPRPDGTVLVGWRLLATDSPTVRFHLFTDGVQVTSQPLACTNSVQPSARNAVYQVQPVENGRRGALSPPIQPWAQPFREIPLQVPAPGTCPDGSTFAYTANDASVGDLDGDGDYDLVLKWEPTNALDPGANGFSGPTILEGLRLDGTPLWRINLGPNIRSGAHYTQFLVYDFDSDGSAEIVCKTADGTIDGAGHHVGTANADHRDANGRVLAGPEYLTVFAGADGRELATVPYIAPRGDITQWGDAYGNRVDRFLACVAYLDGVQPSIVMCRGYYHGRGGHPGRTVLAAWNWRRQTLTQLWTFDTSAGTENKPYVGQGNHNLAVGDVDGDGRDEIIYGACAIDHDGTGLYSTEFGHGDAGHLGDLDPNHPGLEYFMPHESAGNGRPIPGVSFRDAGTGAILWSQPANGDVGRGTAGDITADAPGAECWGAKGLGLFSCTGERIGAHPKSINFVVWWTGDPGRELLDHNWIASYEEGHLRRILTAQGCVANNGTKATPCLSADILGDWREEVIWRTEDNRSLRVYTTPHPTDLRICTLMHDPIYRLSVAWQNVAYNQPPHPGFFLGHGMTPPPHPGIRTPPPR